MKTFDSILENEIVLLRPLKQADFDDLYKVTKDPLIWEQHQNFDRYKLDVFTQFFKNSIRSKGALVVIDKSNNRIIGSSRFNPIPNVNNAIEIGWSFLDRQYWGGIYNKSVKRLMMEYAFQYYESVVFYIDKNNFRSQKATKKNGGQLIENISPLIREVENELTFVITKNQFLDN